MLFSTEKILEEDLSFCKANYSLYASPRKVFPAKKMFWQLKILMVGLPRIGSSHAKSFQTFVKVQNYIIGLFGGLTPAVLLVRVMPLFAFFIHYANSLLSGFMMSTIYILRCRCWIIKEIFLPSAYFISLDFPQNV